MDKKPELDNIPYTVDYRNIKYARLEYKTGTLQLILPKNYTKTKQLLQKHNKWINHKQQTIQEALSHAKTKTLNQNRTIDQLRTLVDTAARKYQTQLAIKVNRIYYRKMKTKWASHSPNGNLTINTLMKYLPEDLIQYITYHEITHAIERKHNENFWNIINRKFKDATNKEKDLLTYWFLIQKT